MTSSPPMTEDAASLTVKSTPVRSLLGFFLITYAVTWTCFIAVAAAVPASTLLGRALVLLGPTLRLWSLSRSPLGTKEAPLLELYYVA